MNFYEVTIRVRPKPEHPLYWDIQLAYHKLWVYATNENEAANKAYQFSTLMDFEVIGDKVQTVADPKNYKKDELSVMCEEGKKSGFAHFIIACTTGTEEGNFDNMWESD